MSDGGHFENTGAYELIRRGVKTIVICDHGADPDYQFKDLENLIRKARIDLGCSINVATKAAVVSHFGERGAALFFNGNPKGWRDGMKDPSSEAFALLLDIYRQKDSDETDSQRGMEQTPDVDQDAETSPYEKVGTIILVKPRVNQDLPYDIGGYALANPTFPQETTGDQFFSAAQWESYRALGYALAQSLLQRTRHGVDVLRHLSNDKSG